MLHDEREPGGIANDLAVVDERSNELDEEAGQESDYAANFDVDSHGPSGDNAD